MNKLLELVSNDDGRISRTQCMILICFLFSMAVIVAHIVFGDVLTVPMLIALGGLHFFCLADRINARHISLEFGKDGARLGMGEESA